MINLYNHTGGIMVHWTEADIATLKAEYGSTSIADLAAKFGRTRAAVYLKASNLKLTKPKARSTPVVQTDAPVG